MHEVHHAALSPISQLSNDILWAIFCLNSDMFDPLEFDNDPYHSEAPAPYPALFTTIRCTHVCRGWRALLMRSPGIWGRVIRVDKLCRLGDKVRDEIVGRTGTAPLCLMGDISDLRLAAMEFFAPFLHENWARIRKVHIFAYDFYDFYDRHWDIATREAPLLEHFSVTYLESFEFYDPGQGQYGELFGGNAPRLRLLHATCMAFKLDDARWLGQLRNLKFHASSIDVVKVVSALRHLPCLELLELHMIEGELDPAQMKAEPIYLPCLFNLCISYCRFHTSIALAHMITPAKDCRFKYNPSTVFIDEVTQEDIEATIRILDRYVGNYLSSPTPLKMRCDTRYGGLGLYISFLQDEELLSFDAGLDSPDMAETTGGPDWLEPLLKYDMSSIRDLALIFGSNIAIHGSMTAFIEGLSGVESLDIPIHELRVLVPHYAKNGATFFPRLKVLHFSPSGRDVYGAERMVKELLLHKRSQNNIPVETLFLDYPQPFGDWEALDAFKGLKVTWWKGIKECQYVCGSGSPEKLNLGESTLLRSRE